MYWSEFETDGNTLSWSRASQFCWRIIVEKWSLSHGRDSVAGPLKVWSRASLMTLPSHKMRCCLQISGRNGPKPPQDGLAWRRWEGDA